MDTRDIDHKLPALLQSAAARAWEQAPVWLSMCESPIEKLFLFAVWARWQWIDRLEVMHLPFKVMREYAKGDTKILCSPQTHIGDYRVDFLFAGDNPAREEATLIAVECDGHEFHEKTKKQAARDKSRDRELMALGIRVLRFTGSEIWRDPGACADQAVGMLVDEFADGWVEVRKRIEREEATQ